MRYFFNPQIPLPSRILLVESGTRRPLERALPALRSYFGESVTMDVFTCIPGAPEGLPAEGTTVYNVNDYRGTRAGLLKTLRRNRYQVMGMVCSDEPIMTKWKWLLAAWIPAKVLVINENGDYFWLDRAHGPAIRYFIKYRAGMTAVGPAPSSSSFNPGVLLFPFVFLYLLLYATVAHLRRVLHKGIP